STSKTFSWSCIMPLLRPRRNRYAQIALTYTRPLPFRLWAALMAVFTVGLFIARKADFAAQIAMLTLGGFLAAWIGPLVTGHAKAQLADARSSLTPRYRAPHLLVAAIIFCAGVVGFSCLLILRMKQIPTA